MMLAMATMFGLDDRPGRARPSPRGGALGPMLKAFALRDSASVENSETSRSAHPGSGASLRAISRINDNDGEMT